MRLEKAHVNLTGTSLLSLHNYYKNDIEGVNRAEIIKFMNRVEEYEKLVEDNTNFQKLYVYSSSYEYECSI